MNRKPKCGNCRYDLHLIQSGLMRYHIKMDGTTGPMFMGTPDQVEKFLVCSHTRCNTQYEARFMDSGQIIRGNLIERGY